MNSRIITSLTAVLFLLVSVINVSARGGGGFDRGKGGYMPFYDTTSVSQETLDSFNKETASLREKMIENRSELQKEYLKDQPDPDTVAKLQKEMIDLRTELQKIADKHGIKFMKKGRGKGGRRGGGGWK